MARILHLSEFTKGGIETHLNEVLQHQRRTHDIYLMVSEQNSNRDTLCIHPERLIIYPYKRSPAPMLRAMKAIRNVVKKIQPDIIHVHGTFAGLFLRSVLFLKRERPVIIYCSHGWSFLMDISAWKKRCYALIESVLALKSDAIIHISRNEYEKALKLGIPKEKSIIVYNGISNLDELQEKPIEVDPNKLNLLFVGRFDRQKGFDRLMQVFREEAFPNVQLYLVGDSVLGDKAAIEIPESAAKLGWVEHSLIGACMEACDAVLVPSRWEGFGIVAIEAMRSRKAVIASNRGALPEIVRNGINGYVFDFDDLKQLKAIIRGLDKATLRKMGEAGEALFREHFHADSMNDQIENLYEEAMKRRGSEDSPAIGKYV
ncbi:glycosyltransferase [Paenibacillus sp. HB172176]|uniref:glycosyltransferase n=1 Tax=Paenibacillus sp. HB172176 TaxID=2493690 RepID=UPI00143919AB|nr:glycosyltransferase [Paenibacillus sp. HB172176]